MIFYEVEKRYKAWAFCLLAWSWSRLVPLSRGGGACGKEGMYRGRGTHLCDSYRKQPAVKFKIKLYT